jgi:hypothetical protein
MPMKSKPGKCWNFLWRGNPSDSIRIYCQVTEITVECNSEPIENIEGYKYSFHCE